MCIEELKSRFLEPEIRAGYHVAAETKATWMIMLNMLEEVDRICRKHDIRYFLIAGSLLGAIRHKGFIPWDDDVDIALLREDYKRLEKVLPLELPENLFMQTLATDPEYEASHMRIRDSTTTGIFDGVTDLGVNYNMGIFIDVFPLDAVPKSCVSKHVLSWFSRHYRDFIASRWRRKNFTCKRLFKKMLFTVIWKMFGTDRIYRFREWLFGHLQLDPLGECVQKACDWGYDHKYRYPVSDLQETIDVPFEYLLLKVPKNYEHILNRTYGDWQKIVKGSSVHSFLEINPHVDYKTTLRSKYGYP